MRQYRTFSNLPPRIQSAILCQVAANRITHYGVDAAYENFSRTVMQLQFDKRMAATARRVLLEMTRLAAAKLESSGNRLFIDAEMAAETERRTQMRLIREQVEYYNSKFDR